MEAGYGYGQESTTGSYRQIYGPADFGTYASPYTKVTHSPIQYKNELVDYIFESINKSKTGDEHKGTIDDIFEDRLDLIRSKIDLILLQVSQRKKIHHEVIYRIDKDSCKAQNLLFNWGTEIYRVDKDRIKIEQIKFDLAKQKRREETDYFNDTSLLNRELREALIQYQEEVQKNALIYRGV